MDEFELIARYFAPLAAAEPGALGLTDDAAVLPLPAGRELVVTADMLVAGVHFRTDDPAESLGVKALAVNLSDLAAMGADPRAYVLALALPAGWPQAQRQDWLAGFTRGLAEMQRTFAIPLAGGDTVATPGPLTLSITAFGTAPPAGPMRRSGARPGDVVWVSGTIGDGALGLQVLDGRLQLDEAALADALSARYRRPQPRLELGRRLAGLAHACADVSDGLVADLAHICRASAVAATIEAARIPLSAAARVAVSRQPALMAAVLGGGDDYELVFTAAESDSPAVERCAADAGTSVRAIGRIAGRFEAGAPPVRVVAADGTEVDFARAGWSHF
ncbi:MAG: thiamine-phosphate kinase [Rhodospirillales bacterium]